MIVNKNLANSAGHMNKDLWETPCELFQKFNEQYQFTLDPCCEKKTAKCEKYFTPSENGLIHSWHGERVFVNPPYSRGNIDEWMKKCVEEYKKGVFIVALLPVSTSSTWFHEYVLPYADLEFLRGRVRFVGAPYTAPFSSMLAIYDPNK